MASGKLGPVLRLHVCPVLGAVCLSVQWLLCLVKLVLLHAGAPLDDTDNDPGSVQDRSFCPGQKVPLAEGTMGGSPSTEQPGQLPVTGPASVLGHHCKTRKANLPLTQGLTHGPWAFRFLSGGAQAIQEEAMSYDPAQVFLMTSSQRRRTSDREGVCAGAKGPADGFCQKYGYRLTSYPGPAQSLTQASNNKDAGANVPGFQC